MRDAGWYATPGRAGRYHVVVGWSAFGDETQALLAACSPVPPGATSPRMVLDDLSEQAAADVPDHMRCRRPGCRQRWPDRPT